MRSAIADHPNASNLTVDYFDRQRLATWVRDHPALGPWVRARVGRPMQGWRSYGDWGSVGDGSPNEFIANETARLYAGSGRSGQPDAALSTLTGLQRMRAVLGRPASSLRLIGLSGVGKTRLVTALFDENVGTEALDPNLAIYADLAHHPEPTPVALATYLLSRQARSIIIVDNCPAELHGQLTQLCRTLGSRVNLVTVEYDIREDTAEGAEVFRLEAASEDVVAKVVIARCPWLSQVDAQSIGVFSGGNARVGLALAHTTRAGESLSGLSNEDLFSRLFRQRHDEDAGLRASAEACALVYSFDGETMTGDEFRDRASCCSGRMHAASALPAYCRAQTSRSPAGEKPMASSAAPCDRKPSCGACPGDYPCDACSRGTRRTGFRTADQIVLSAAELSARLEGCRSDCRKLVIGVRLAGFECQKPEPARDDSAHQHRARCARVRVGGYRARAASGWRDELLLSRE